MDDINLERMRTALDLEMKESISYEISNQHMNELLDVADEIEVEYDVGNMSNPQDITNPETSVVL